MLTVKSQQVDHVKAERNVLAEVHNPYVVKLLYSFQVGALLHHLMQSPSASDSGQLCNQPQAGAMML